ncbi:MAG: glycosyltransferase [Candidatus Odinarchaeota archaeon]
MRVCMLSVHGDPLGVLGEPDTGGQCLYIKEIMKNLVKQGHTVDAYTRRWGQKPEIEFVEGIEKCCNIRLPCGSSDFIPKEKLKPHLAEFYGNLTRFIEEKGFKYDVINSHYWDAGLIGIWMANDYNIYLVHTSHSLGAIKKASMPEDEQSEYDERIEDEKKIYAASSAVIAESRQEKKDLVSIYGVSNEKIHIIPAGVDVDRYSPRGSRIEAKKHLNLGDEFLILSLGRLDARKGFDLLVRTIPHVVSELKDKGKKIKYVLSAGSIDELSDSEQKEYGRIMDICQELGVTDHFEMIPRIEPLNLVPYWYTAADVFTVPSRYETFGLVIVEAMGCKTPVVATNNGGPPDIITNGVEGYTVSPEDTKSFAKRIVDCVKDPEIQTKLGEAARKTVVKNYSWKAVTEQISELYSSLLD